MINKIHNNKSIKYLIQSNWPHNHDTLIYKQTVTAVTVNSILLFYSTDSYHFHKVM